MLRDQHQVQEALHLINCFLILQEVHAQYRAMLDDTTQQQTSTVKRERDQHAAEREQMQRYVCIVCILHYIWAATDHTVHDH